MRKSVDEIKTIIGDGGNSDELATILAVEVESGSVPLVEVVLALEGLLTAEDREARCQGTRILASLLQLLPPETLSPADCLSLLTFLLDRLQDHYTIVPSALAGLSALTLAESCLDHAARLIIDGLHKNVICQTLTVSHRYTYYSIFQNIFSKMKKKVLSELSAEFLLGLVSGASSEHDPRNLLFLFSFLPAVLSQLPLGHLKEDTFILLESYFPVDYNPIKENDPITREDLATSLEACLTATPELGELCLPMIIEKLESSLPVAQADSLKLLMNGVPTWGVESLASKVEELWAALRAVLFSTQVSPLAGQALVAVLKAFSLLPLSDNQTKAFYFLLQSLSSCSHSFLSEPGLTLFSPTMRLLSEVAAASSTTADFIIPRVLPQLVALLESNCSSSNKETVLKTLHPLLETSITFNSWKSDVCKKHLEDVLPALMKLLSHPDTCGPAFRCISAIHSKFDKPSRENIYNLVKKILPLELSKNTWEECGHLLRVLSETYPEEVEACFLSAFSLPEWGLEGEQKVRAVSLLAAVLEAQPLAEPTARLLLKFISEDAEEYSRWRAATVFSLRERCGEQEGLMGAVGQDFVLALLKRYSTRPPDTETLTAATLICLLFRTLSSQEQSTVMMTGLELLADKGRAPADQTTELVVMEGLLAGLRAEVEVPDVSALSQRLFQLALSTETPLARTSAARLLALILNKTNSGEFVLEVMCPVGTLALKDPASVELLAWLTKALVLRAHPHSEAALDKLLGLTSDENIGNEAAQGVRLVLEESPVLSPRNFCKIGILYKQRVFEKFKLLIPPSGKPSKAAALALAYILKYSPSSLVIGHFEKLGRVMVHCLEDGEKEVCSTVLEILATLLQSLLPELASHAQDLIPRFITLANQSPFMEVRRKALDCIYSYADYKVEDILPYKTKVVLELQPCLDDKKRLVRQSAVRARTRWFLV